MTPRILLVDDEHAFRYATEKALRAAGFDVLAAPTPYHALDALEADGPHLDLLLTDIVMPDGVNGFALARMARLRRRELKVLYITGYDVPTVDTGAPVLRKPITDVALIAEVRALLAAA
ncbi:MAG: response regulator [Gemmatimonas sp.]